MLSSNSRGFTLVEMMISMIVLGIMVAIAAPSFQSLIATQKIKTAATSLQSSLNITRAEALKRNTNVTLSPKTPSQWNSGWNVLDPSTGNSVFSVQPFSTLTITGPSTVTYQPNGRINATTSSIFKITASGTSNIRCVSVALTGIAIVTSSGC